MLCSSASHMQSSFQTLVASRQENFALWAILRMFVKILWNIPSLLVWGICLCFSHFLFLSSRLSYELRPSLTHLALQFLGRSLKPTKMPVPASRRTRLWSRLSDCNEHAPIPCSPCHSILFVDSMNQIFFLSICCSNFLRSAEAMSQVRAPGA